MSSFTLKIIAIVTMTIDHVGYVFFPDVIWLRWIGRLAFPVFAWLISMGAVYSKQPTAYAKRLLMFACISEIPFYLAFFDPVDPFAFTKHNIFFTLLLGLLAILCIKERRLGLYRYLGVLALILIASFGQTDYGAYGVLLILGFSLSQGVHNPGYRLLGQTVGLYAITLIKYGLSSIQIYSLASLPLIHAYNGKQGARNTRFFYWFYPVHLLLIALARLIWTN